jgi:hypothetical protein
MSKPWSLGEGETIYDCIAPTSDPWQMPVCAECGQVAYQVVIIKKVERTTRQIPLCARHFVSACLQLPELNKYNRGGKLG